MHRVQRLTVLRHGAWPTQRAFHILPPHDGEAGLVFAGIARSAWQSDEALSQLIAELSNELLEAQKRNT